MDKESPPSLSQQFKLKQPWLAALPLSLSILAIYLYLFYRWFALADRYNIFLYNHDMGPLVPDTSPFSYVTSSRYWMAGLVAGGLVMFFYAFINWSFARVRRAYRIPDWWRCWLLVALPLLLAIPATTMTLNKPVLPLELALRVTAVTLAGLALALQPGRLAAEKPRELLLLGLDGLGLMLPITTLVGIEHLTEWLERGSTHFVTGMLAASFAGLLIMGMVTLVRWRLDRPGNSATDILLAGLVGAYLLLPMLHHLLFTDGYFYITDADNFLARNLNLQAAIWLLATAIALAFYRLRIRLTGRASSKIA